MSKPGTTLGHGAGTGNGSLNGNKANVASNNSFLNFKPNNYEIHNHQHDHFHQHESTRAGKTLMFGAGAVVSAAVVWGTSQALSSKTETPQSSREAGEASEEEEETTNMSAKLDLEILRRKRRQLS